MTFTSLKRFLGSCGSHESKKDGAYWDDMHPAVDVFVIKIIEPADPRRNSKDFADATGAEVDCLRRGNIW